MDDIGDDFSELNAGSDSNSDENSDNERDDNGINNKEINNLHEENNEPEVIPIRPRITYPTNRLVNSIGSAFDESNFDPVQGFSEETLLTDLLEPKKKEQAEKRIEWTSKWPNSTGSRGRQNVIREKPGSTRHSRTATTPLDSWWKLFLSDEIIHESVVHMNEKITAFQNNLSNEILQNDKYTYIHTTNVAEVYAFIGLIYARRLVGQNNVVMVIQFLQRQYLKTVLDFYINAFCLMITQQEPNVGRQIVSLQFEKYLNCSIKTVAEHLFQMICCQLMKHYTQ